MMKRIVGCLTLVTPTTTVATKAFLVADPPWKTKQNNLSKEEFLALKQLRQKNNIAILKIDKVNSTVTLNKADYIKKPELTRT